jgi:coenzyme F420 hydrogenase subunit beta
MALKLINDIVQWQLCSGCGACAYAEPQRYRMGDSFEYGRRPFVCDKALAESGDAVKVCPGVGLTHTTDRRLSEDLDLELLDAWGPVLEVWEGYASDPEIRFAGSSGGAITALSLYCLERGNMAGVVHTAANPNIPYLNETVMSASRAELLARAGSRYSPASPADGLGLVETAKTPCVFIGKPCDAAAAQKARRLRSTLDEKLGLVIAFFCAGVPSTQGVIDLLRNNGIDDLDLLKSLRFRGNGWPGMWTARFTNTAGLEETRQLTYAESWGFLQKYRQWRCYICPDHTGEFADIAVGDPWYRDVQPGDPGKSLIIARTARGREIIHAAAANGYIRLETRDPSLLPRSQDNILTTRAALWGRLVTLRIMGAAIPKFEGFRLFRLWWFKLTLRQKAQSFVGTAKRVLTKGLKKRTAIKERSPISARAPK